MKKHLLILLSLVMAGFVFVSCSDDDEPAPEATLTVAPTSMTFEAVDNSEQIATVTTNQESWTITPDATQPWASFTKKDNTVVVKVTSENTGESSRKAVGTVKAGGKTATITVTQKAAGEVPGEEVKITVAPTSLEFAADDLIAQTVTFTVTEGATVTANSVEGWTIKVAADNKSATIVPAAANTTEQDKTATVTFTAEKDGKTATANVALTQKGKAGEPGGDDLEQKKAVLAQYEGVYSGTGKPSEMWMDNNGNPLIGPTSWTGVEISLVNIVNNETQELVDIMLKVDNIPGIRSGSTGMILLAMPDVATKKLTIGEILINKDPSTGNFVVTQGIALSNVPDFNYYAIPENSLAQITWNEANKVLTIKGEYTDADSGMNKAPIHYGAPVFSSKGSLVGTTTELYADLTLTYVNALSKSSSAVANTIFAPRFMNLDQQISFKEDIKRF